MEPTFNTSFIPKKSLQADIDGKNNSRYVKRRSIYGPGFFLTSVIFALAVLVSVGIFGYTKVVEQSIADKIGQIEKILQQVNNAEITAELARLDLRLLEARKLVADHVAVSELLYALEDITLKSVQYTDLTFGAQGPMQSPTKGGVQGLLPMSVTGLSDSYEHVAVQTDLYRNHKYLSNEVITILEQDDENVSFEAHLQVDPQLVLFEHSLAESKARSTVPVTSVTPQQQVTPVATSTPGVPPSDTETDTSSEQETTPPTT